MFSKITYHSDLGTTPARVNRKTGELQINLPVWERLTPDEKRFVELHEEGHLVLQTRNELAADRYAFKKYAEEGRSLKAGVKSLTKMLQDKPTHLIRSNEILKQAANFQKNNSMSTGNIFITEAWENFLGFGKKARARREEKREFKFQKKYDKNERKNILAEAKAQQKVLLAEKGVSAGGMLAGGIGNAVGNLGSTFANVATGGLSGVLGGIGSTGLPPASPSTNLPSYSSAEMSLGGGGGGGSFQEAYQNYPSLGAEDYSTGAGGLSAITGKDNKNLPWIIGGVLAVVVVIALIMRKG